MWKWVVRDYFAAFRWEKLKETSKGWGWMVIYLLLFYPTWLDVYDSERRTLCYYVISVPILLTIISGSLHPIRLPKIMYLCPLTKEERKDYIRYSTIFCVLMNVLLGGIAVMILLEAKIVGLKIAGVLLWNMGTITLVFCGLAKKKAQSANASVLEQASASGKVAGAINFLISLATTIAIVAIFCWKEQSVTGWVEWIFVGIVVLIQIPLMLSMLKARRTDMEDVASYERSYL